MQFLWVIDQAERLVVAGKREKQILQFIRQCVLDAGLPFKICLVLRLDHFDVLNTQLGDMHIDTFIVGPLLPLALCRSNRRPRTTRWIKLRSGFGACFDSRRSRT